MNNKILVIVLVAMLLTLTTLIVIVSRDAKTAYGDVAPDEYTIATSTPQVADRANLCPANLTTASSTRGVLDFITVNAPLAADFLIMDATTTNSALRFPAATSSNILIWLPAGYGTSTPIKLGVQFTRGLLVDYGAGNASTTIGYRCDGQNAR